MSIKLLRKAQLELQNRKANYLGEKENNQQEEKSVNLENSFNQASTSTKPRIVSLPSKKSPSQNNPSPSISPLKPKTGNFSKHRVPISNMYIPLNPTLIPASNFLAFAEAISAVNRITQSERQFSFRVNIKVNRGNNEKVIQETAKRRSWWSVVTKQVDNYNKPGDHIDKIQFLWTQKRDEDFMGFVREGDRNMGIEQRMDYSFAEAVEACRLYMTDSSFSVLRRYMETSHGRDIFQVLKKFTQIDDFLEALRAYVSRITAIKNNGVLVADPFEEKTKQSIQTVTSLNFGSFDEYRRIKPTNTHVSPETSLRSIPISKSGLKNRIYMRSIRLHNHIQGNEQLGDKMNLLNNLSRYMNDHPSASAKYSLFKMIPFTITIGSLVDDSLIKFKLIHEILGSSRIKGSNGRVSSNGQSNSVPITLDFFTIKTDQNLWILKPGENSNRGRGIIVSKDIEEIIDFVRNSDTSVVIQKYIENPLLYHGRKFDLRMYILITMTNGVYKLYFYKHGYGRTSSFDFSLTDNSNNVHLTNESIQIKYKEFSKFEKGNKLTLPELATYIRRNIDPSIDFFDKYIPLMKVRYSLRDRNMRLLVFLQPSRS